jgi:hypothetical protein
VTTEGVDEAISLGLVDLPMKDDLLDPLPCKNCLDQGGTIPLVSAMILKCERILKFRTHCFKNYHYNIFPQLI